MSAMLKHAENHAVAGPSKSNSNNNSGGDAASGTQPPQRRRRKANFSSEEVDILVREVSARRHILFGSGANGRSELGAAAAKATEKLAAWRAVAATVNAANRGEPRTVREIRKKWENVTSTFRKRQLGDLGPTMELEPHLLTGGRCPMEEVLACAKAYQANRIVQQQRRTAAVAVAPFLDAYQTDEVRLKEEYSSSEDDLILDIQPDVHIESLETPLTFTDSDDVNSRNETNNNTTNNGTNSHSHSRQLDDQGPQDGVFAAHDSSEGEANASRYQGNRQLLQLQQQLKSGEVIISPALQPEDYHNAMANSSRTECGSREPRTQTAAAVAQDFALQAASTSARSLQTLLRKQTIEEQKLSVMKQLLKIESKRLKIEKKRLKIEKYRLKLLTNDSTLCNE